MLMEKDAGESNGCDFCSGLNVPMCLDYCKESDLLRRFLDALRERKRQESSIEASQ